jgi:hypothetical protein
MAEMAAEVMQQDAATEEKSKSKKSMEACSLWRVCNAATAQATLEQTQQ